ncbi:MAG: hypothetical protein MK106_04520 [Mariniblastus sp.]|nr:hypothetical protein [Mariniblastus sp.]
MIQTEPFTRQRERYTRPRFWMTLLSSCLALVGNQTLSGQELNQEAAERRLATLDGSRLVVIARNRKDFDAKTPEKQQQLRDLYGQLSQHPDHEKLEQVLRQYHDWLATLDDQTRATVLDLPAQERIVKINQIRRQQNIDWLGKIGPTQLPKEDAVPVYWWYEEMLKTKNELIFDVSQQLSKRGIIEFNKQLFSGGLLRWDEYKRRSQYIQRNVAERLLIAIQEESPESLNEIFYASDINNLMSYLSNKGREILQESEPGERSLLVVRWMADAREIQSRNSIPEKALNKFYETELTPETRDELDAMSAVARRETLVDLYTKWRRRDLPSAARDRLIFPRGF